MAQLIPRYLLDPLTFAMDFIGPLPKSRGFNTLLVITDRLTDYVMIEPRLGTATAEDVARLDYRTWYRRFGLPKSIVSDRDKLFVSKFWRKLHRLLDIKIKMSTSYHPETDGSSERSNKTVIEFLRHYVNRRQTDWPDHLVHVETAINNSVNATTEYHQLRWFMDPAYASSLAFATLHQILLSQRLLNSCNRSQNPSPLPGTITLRRKPYRHGISTRNVVRSSSGK
jgi:transposase InsO family protein